MAGPFRRPHRRAAIGSSGVWREGCGAVRRPAAGAATVEGECDGGGLQVTTAPPVHAYAGGHLIVLSIGDVWN